MPRYYATTHNVRTNGVDRSLVRMDRKPPARLLRMDTPPKAPTKADLVAAAEARGVDTKGKKADIAARLGAEVAVTDA